MLFSEKKHSYYRRSKYKKKKERFLNIVKVLQGVGVLLISLCTLIFSAQLQYYQKQHSQQQSAKEIERFWTEVEGVIANSSEHSSKLGVSLTEYIIAASEFMTYYHLEHVHKDNKVKPEFDVRYLGLKSKFIGSYANLTSVIEQVGIDFDFIRVKYHQSVSVNQLIGWKEFFNATAEVNEWKSNNRNAVNEIYHMVNQATSVELEEDLLSYGDKMSLKVEYMTAKLNFFVLPYVNPIYRFVGENLTGYSEQLH